MELARRGVLGSDMVPTVQVMLRAIRTLSCTDSAEESSSIEAEKCVSVSSTAYTVAAVVMDGAPFSDDTNAITFSAPYPSPISFKVVQSNPSDRHWRVMAWLPGASTSPRVPYSDARCRELAAMDAPA